MPYAMLSGVVDENNLGVSMGLFNMFIVLPQIIAATGGINFLTSFLGDQPIFAMVVAGLSLFIAAALNFLIKDHNLS
jgi:maltose/moltooligosaccharide transporter